MIKIFDIYFQGIGDQVFALGYPSEITSSFNNLPIAKSCYIASHPGQEFSFETNCINRNNKRVKAVAQGKIIVVDGLILGGNSGGPVVIPVELKFTTDSIKGLLHANIKDNLVLGIVSSSIGSSGINLIYSSDYIKSLILAFYK